jgi:hypothetical protein
LPWPITKGDDGWSDNSKGKGSEDLAPRVGAPEARETLSLDAAGQELTQFALDEDPPHWHSQGSA